MGFHDDLKEAENKAFAGISEEEMSAFEDATDSGWYPESVASCPERYLRVFAAHMAADLEQLQDVKASGVEIEFLHPISELERRIESAQGDLAEAQAWEGFCPRTASPEELEAAIASEYFWGGEIREMRKLLADKAQVVAATPPPTALSQGAWGALDGLAL